jgi:hypothetical protein
MSPSSEPPVALFFLIGFALLAYLSVPPLLRALATQSPTSFDELGRPKWTMIFSRDPCDWKFQYRFLKFVLMGRAWHVTNGSARTLAGAVWLAYAGLFVSLIWFIFAVL